MDHQFSLFGWQKPIGKVPISAERIREVKEEIAKGNGKKAAIALRDIREKLQNFEQRISHKPH